MQLKMFPEKNKNALKNGRQIDTYLAKYFNKKKQLKLHNFYILFQPLHL